MFLFIQAGTQEYPSMVLFKYISCSYLSREILTYRYIKGNSNTSHVLIYRRKEKGKEVNAEFKYISCSYLSTGGSRYCKASLIQIHLMFLFIPEPELKGFRCSHSNTSHVLIYPHMQVLMHQSTQIQIHLMFLFIKNLI